MRERERVGETENRIEEAERGTVSFPGKIKLALPPPSEEEAMHTE